MRTPANWLLTTNLGADAFLFGTPDASVFDFPAVAPGTTVTVVFDSTNLLGLFAFAWDVGAPSGFVNSGTFVLSAEWWDGDPFLGGAFIANAEDLTAPYSATVTAVPEPGTAWLLLSAVGVVLSRRRQQRS